jgi:hypothetical protein
MTRPDCRVRGREEWIYTHTQDGDARIVTADGTPNSDIAIAYGCTENGEHRCALKTARAYRISIARSYLYGAPCARADPRVHGARSTIGKDGDGSTQHIIRTYLTDSAQSKYIFDFPLSDALR